jgi:nucleoside-diphosphate-sugar epimerase
MHFLSTTDLSDLIMRIVNSWKSGYGILTVGDEFHLTFSDLAKKLTELDENVKIDFTDSDCSGVLKFSNTDLRDEHGWFARISLVEDLKDQYESFLAAREERTVFARIKE